MSAHIPNPAPRSKGKSTLEYHNPSPGKKNFKSKARRSKTPECTLRHSGQLYQYSSADSGSDIVIDRESNRSFYENSRPVPRGRQNRKEISRRNRSRERSLDDTLSSQDVPPLYIQQIVEDFHANAPNSQSRHDWHQQDSHSHGRSATHPGVHSQHPKSFTDTEMHELLELRARNEQMEKTLRWWSECTANWREKWTKVRSERNHARNELKQVKSELEEASKELVVLREQRGRLVQENNELRHEFRSTGGSASDGSSPKINETRQGSDVADASANKSQRPTGRSSLNNSHVSNKVVEDELPQKIAALQLKVDESAKTIQAERDAKLSLNKTIEKLEQELTLLKQKYEEIKEGKQDALKQLTRLRESHRSEVVRINENLEEEIHNRSQQEKKIHDLREEIERLQAENTSEWGRRERMETEKLQLERENKRLKSVAEEMKSSLDRKRKSVAEDRDNELRQAQAEIHDLNEEVNELRRQSVKDNKLLDGRQEELLHSRRRAEQHETEVRQLRNRVEEIKKQQANTEDELDNAQNQGRKLIRVVEEKEEEIEKLHLQMDQMHTRMRREPGTSTWSKTTAYNKREVDHTPSSSESSCEI